MDGQRRRVQSAGNIIVLVIVTVCYYKQAVITSRLMCVLFFSVDPVSQRDSVGRVCTQHTRSPHLNLNLTLNLNLNVVQATNFWDCDLHLIW